MVHQKERESYPQRVGLAILVVVPTVHFGVGSVLAVAAAALGRSLTAAVVASNLGQWSITFGYHVCYHAQSTTGGVQQR
jgi:hypothetical protein